MSDTTLYRIEPNDDEYAFDGGYYPISSILDYMVEQGYLKPMMPLDVLEGASHVDMVHGVGDGCSDCDAKRR